MMWKDAIWPQAVEGAQKGEAKCGKTTINSQFSRINGFPGEQGLLQPLQLAWYVVERTTPENQHLKVNLQIHYANKL